MTKRQVRRQANEAGLWKQRRELADRSPVDAASVAFDLARKEIRAVRDPDERDRRWRQLAELVSAFTAELHNGVSSQMETGSGPHEGPRRAPARDEV